MTKALDRAVDAAARRRARAMSPPSPLEIASALAERKATAREIEENAEQAVRLHNEVDSLRTDLDRYRTQHAALSALGKEHVTMPMKSYDVRYHIEVEWEPIKSLYSGDELAARIQERIDSSEGRIAELEAEIARLLGD